MGSTEALSRSVRRTHEQLGERLEVLRTQFGPPGTHEELAGPHRGYQPIDEFVTTASRHLHAVNEVLIPRARRVLPDGRQLTHQYLDAVRVLEVVLAHVKAHEYGSVWEKRIAWPAVWSEVGTALEAQRMREEQLADQLTDQLDDEEIGELTERLADAEPREPSRPHPYLPHLGPVGSLARGVVKRTDRAWDLAEGRPLTWPSRRKRKPPGLLGQYLLADPRFDPDEREEQEEQESR